ncbi:MAG: hypothetical protein KIT07_01010 [Anaerolineales bacterium]|jgi:hypothetical protein|nr:hypothetical protein [Rhodocyclaceae bacterium]MCW5886686.1 hypothetical protein [Anaerolineales bacterium]
MSAKIVNFDKARRVRRATCDSDGRQCLAPNPHVIDRTLLTEQMVEWQKNLDQASCHWAAQSLQLGFHITQMMTMPLFFMVAHTATPAPFTPVAEFGDRLRKD